MRNTLSAIALPAGAMLAALLLFGVLVWFAGRQPAGRVADPVQGRVWRLVLLAEHACSGPPR